MALTTEQETGIVSDIAALHIKIAGADSSNIENIDDQLDGDKASLAGNGTDTTKGTSFLLGLKGSKV